MTLPEIFYCIGSSNADFQNFTIDIDYFAKARFVKQVVSLKLHGHTQQRVFVTFLEIIFNDESHFWVSELLNLIRYQST